uniref:little elongation complex subunit 2-like n=2 Tax=Myxine glutinosa TaxID=7769 RepID=UPI00358E8AAF
MEIDWDVEPFNGKDCFFTKETYEKHGFNPTLKELWSFLNRPSQDVEETVPSMEIADSKTSLESKDSTRPPDEANVGPLGNVLEAEVKGHIEENSKLMQHPNPMGLLPPPRVPFPRLSSLSHAEHRQFLFFLHRYGSSIPRCPSHFRGDIHEFHQYLELKHRVAEEALEFLKYAHNAAKQCFQDYELLGPEPLRFTEEYFVECAKRVQSYPRYYSLEQTLCFSAGLGPLLEFQHEKTLLSLGETSFVKVPLNCRPSCIRYNSTYEAVAPALKRLNGIVDVSRDDNAARLAATYGAKLVICENALLTLLDNRSPDFMHQWELPVHVEELQTENGLQKVVFIDDPLAKKEQATRDKNQLFYQAALEATMSRELRIGVQSMTLDESKINVMWSSRKQTTRGRMHLARPQIQSDGDLLDDYTDIETFGTITDVIRKAPLPHNIPSECRPQNALAGDAVSMQADRKPVNMNYQICSLFGFDSGEDEGHGEPDLVRIDGSPLQAPNSHDTDQPISSIIFEPASSPSESELIIDDESECNNQGKKHIVNIKEATLMQNVAVQTTKKEEEVQTEGMEIKQEGMTDKECIKQEARQENIDMKETIFGKDTTGDEIATETSTKETIGNEAHLEVEVVEEEEQVEENSEKEMGGNGEIMAKIVNIKKETFLMGETVSEQMEFEETVSEEECGAEEILAGKSVIKQETMADKASGKEVIAKEMITGCAGPDSNQTCSGGVKSEDEVGQGDSAGPAVSLSGKKKKAKRSDALDPVGQILHMQMQMLENKVPSNVHLPSTANMTQCGSPRAANSPGRYLHHGIDSTGGMSAQATPYKPVFSRELLSREEHPVDFQSPFVGEGNAVYKLFSLGELPLLVRLQIHKAQTKPRKNTGYGKQHFPVSVLAKMEYQPFLGLEEMTGSEACWLWVQNILNSRSCCFLGRFNALNSALLRVEEIPPHQQRTAPKCTTFVPSTALRVLQQILKHLCSLSPGDFLLSHSPGNISVTLQRAAPEGKVPRAAYDLHDAHSRPSNDPLIRVPWVPLDQTLLLPYHWELGWVPCTFPPNQPDRQMNCDRGSMYGNTDGGRGKGRRGQSGGRRRGRRRGRGPSKK